MAIRRSLHWVFKIGDRPLTIDFLVNKLKMHVLRHEEFKEGCDAACNGPYQGRWSKTMVGYGAEDSNFVLELTYNYGIDKYEIGNDFLGIDINSKDLFESVEGELVSEDTKTIVSPDGYTFCIKNVAPTGSGPVSGVTLASSNLTETIKFWKGILGLKMLEQTEDDAIFGFDENQASVKFVKQSEISHGTAYGRVAFSLPVSELPEVERAAVENKNKILTPFITLSTEGKADVSVVIFSDPDGHEICFVGDEGFRELSKLDPEGARLLDMAMSEDKSKEWFAKKGKAKSAAPTV